MSTLHRSPAIHRAITIADTSWTLLWRGVLYVAPLGIGVAEILAMTTTQAQRPGVLLLLAAVVVAGTAAAVYGRQSSRPRRQRSASVRAINRRAAWILIPSALGLATVLAILATRPAGLWLLAYVAVFGLIGLVAFEVAHVIVLGFQRITARSTQ